MSGYGESRWHDECFGRCDECPSCVRRDNNNENLHCSFSKRFVTVGSVRYGLRFGAVSPPPPGIGPRYRSQCCWPSGVGSVPGCVSQIPLLAASPINSPDIFKCVNRLRMADDATSELGERATGRDQVFHNTKSLLKNRLRRRALVRPQDYSRLFECGEGEGADIPSDTLDRLPRFRFGGNRGNNTKARERERRNNEQRATRDLPELLKKQHHHHHQQQQQQQPVPPPRVKHVSSRVAQLPVPPIISSPEVDEDAAQRTLPLRSASFSQVDYSVDDNKYVRRRQPSPSDGAHVASEDSLGRGAFTLPRLKGSSPKNEPSGASEPPPTTRSTDVNISNVQSLCDIIYRECKPDNKIKDFPNELPGLQKVDEESVVPKRNSGSDNNDHSLKAQESKRDKSRRRKGIYISQWPNSYQSNENLIPQFVKDGDFPLYADPIRPVTPNVEIPKLKISEPKPDNFEIWSSPQEEPLSPEDNATVPEWNFSTQIGYQSEERDVARHNSRSNQLLRADSLSEGEPDQGERKQDQQSLQQSDLSDCESRLSVGNDVNASYVQRRYSKRPLRGPYGQMLEAEMKRPEQDRKCQYSSDLKFLEDLSAGSGMSTISSLSSSSSVGAGDPKPKYVLRCRGASNHSLDDSQLKSSGTLSPSKSSASSHATVKRKVSADSIGNELAEQEQKVATHQRTTSSPSKLEAYAEVSPELLEQLLKGSSEQLATEANQQRVNDTRTHVVVELYDTERHYVESLQILVTKYLEPLKSPENATLLDSSLVDEIFYQIPSLLNHHQVFLDELKKRLEHWDVKQKVGDVFLDMFSKQSVIENYTSYVNNWKRAREIIKCAQQSKPAFAKFLEAMAREHKGKLALDSLLIKPIQKFPKYELLLQRLIKHTDPSHPDHSLLLAAQREVHDQLLKINCTEREALELEQLREIEGLIEGLIELVASDRQYLRHDLVSMSAGGGTRKERALFLFSDLLLVTSIKRRSGTIRRPTGQGSVTSTLEANKYKLLMKIPLDDLEIVRSKDENLRQMMLEITNLTEDIGTLNQINELTWSLHCNHGPLEDVVKEMLTNLNKQLADQQNSDSQLSCLDLTLNTSNGLENVSIVFNKPEKRQSWEEAFNDAKHKLAISGDRRASPELVATVPIRKTRAGLQFTCAAPTLGDNGKDVWVCNSDGYVGQVCILSLHPEPTVTSCNGVCNARILCIVSVPGISSNSSSSSRRNTRCENEEHSSTTIQFDSSSSSDECDKSDADEPGDLHKNISAVKSSETISIDSDDADTHQSTMWLGTEDGCIHVYNSTDNIRIKKNKIKLQHGSSILCIIYLDNKVFVSLANGDLTIYERDSTGGWNINSPLSVSVGTTSMPVSKILPNAGKLWCSCGNTIKIFNTNTLATEHNFLVNNDSNKHVTSMVLSGNGVWLSLQNSAIVKCFHAISYENLGEVNVAPAVTKMLTSCDDIIRQHKAACLRVTSLLACKDLLWVGTSAGVLLTMPIPHITSTTSKLNGVPSVIGVPHGHTGHVRFLTHVEWQAASAESSSHKTKQDQRSTSKMLVISGGDGYEDFRSSNMSEVAGREDSTNHLLLWNI